MPIAPRRRRKRSARFRNSLRLGALLVGLTAVNVYVFVFRQDTAVKNLLAPQSTSRTLADEKGAIMQASAGAVARKGSPAASKGLNPKSSVTPDSRPMSDRSGSDRSPGTPVAKAQGAAAEAAPADGPGLEGNTTGVSGKIGPMDTLGSVLAREGFSAAGAANVVAALSKLVDPRSIKPGDAYLVTPGEDGSPESFEYAPSPVARFIVSRDEDGAWKARKEEKALETRTGSAAGAIESSLYESVHQAGESSALVALLVDIFAWDINFFTDTHPGDTWKVVVEKHYLGDNFYKYGRVLAAEYSGRVGTFRAFDWSPSAKVPSRYYDEKGQAIAKTLLKTPLRFVRVSSKFDRKRFHPVLHTTKAHLGVDYAAPTGTPVWASASGKVVECAMKRGSGNTVVINHGNGLATRYYHLSRFAKGLKAGMYVRQKDVIGYVGTTGLSTGPHLHFGLTKNGAFVDPLKLPMAREAPVSDKGAFLATIRPRLATLKGLEPKLAKAGPEPAPTSPAPKN